ncbi:MAG: aspartate 1-decarboxylase [Sedimentisphaerales bacterium]
MLLKMLKSKLHHARVTETRLNYPGSILIDSTLMKRVGILPYESVLVADLNNGNRVEFSFAYCTPAEAHKLKPKVVLLDKHNKIINRKS